MKTKNTNPKPRTKRPLFVFKFKMGQFTWIAACRRCSFAKGYYSHPLAMKAALSHHSKCLNTPSAQTCSYGWLELQSLWSEGEVPLRRKTADQLPVTTFFKGRRVGISGAGSFMCVGESENGKFILSAIDFLPSSRPAEEWEVLEDYGTFQKPEGK